MKAASYNTVRLFAAKGLQAASVNLLLLISLLASKLLERRDTQEVIFFAAAEENSGSQRRFLSNTPLCTVYTVSINVPLGTSLGQIAVSEPHFESQSSRASFLFWKRNVETN